jgi:N-hydroxyarylamine O-acetyltransferase
MELAAYLVRIGFEGTPRPDLATLREVHRRHLLAIPYENLDVQLGRRSGVGVEAAYDKIVGRGRGGWCYEMNGLLGWALGEIGFEVTRMAGGVMRAVVGDVMVGNHLVLRVDLDQPWIADAGFGDGPLEPFVLAEAPFSQGAFDFRLEAVEDGWWRVHNHQHGGAASFDFRSLPADDALLSEKCEFLQTSPLSPFVQNAVVQRHTPEGLVIMRGRVLRTIGAGGVEERLVGSAEEYVAVLKDRFALDLPEAGALWSLIVERHEALFAQA